MKKASGIVLPGSTIGVLGSGQLGRMFAISARRMGYRVHTYSPDRDSPTGQIADVEIDAPYEDLDRVRRFASAVDAVTSNSRTYRRRPRKRLRNVRLSGLPERFCTRRSIDCARRPSCVSMGFP